MIGFKGSLNFVAYMESNFLAVDGSKPFVSRILDALVQVPRKAPASLNFLSAVKMPQYGSCHI